jgi:hypothetical protein
VLGLAVPVTQLRTVNIAVGRCCCPDPAVCHCPSHSSDNPASTMERCGRNATITAAAVLAAFAVPAPPVAVAVVSTPAPVLPLSPPHAPPDPDRPAAPS